MNEQLKADIKELSFAAGIADTFHGRNCCAALDRIEDALQSLPNKWQPIDTAPRDGTFVLVCEKDNSAIYEARFMWDDWYPAMQSDSDEYAPMKGYPSHWMPLPEPPQERKD